MRTTAGWRADGPAEKLNRVSLQRRDLRADDIAVRVDHCGVCHTDLQSINAARGPVVPGHEFTGTVTEVGAKVTRFAVGDPVAVGNIVDSCGECAMCRAGQENFCHEFPTLTYGGTDRHDGTTTLGGYTREHVVRDAFAYALPAGLDAAAAAPLLCAGIAVWEPLRSLGVGRGTRVAVAGLGGLGHLAVKFAVALGAEVAVISRTPGKLDDALRLGARDLLVSTDEARMAASRERFDVMIDTISAAHELGPYLRLVAMDGALAQVGHLGPVSVDTMDLLIGRKKLTSAGSGGRPATQEMLDFCAEHDITADVEVLPSSQVNEALERLSRNDVRHRFVLDMSDLD
ncbi:NAD(P)-dependent alcohol dehydrogenase [Saccharopolyspora karakumensis]|uniref:alcohol dehydrogenase (NADP(+)) n=1 Tax=Saccharopolyspora karakumensis TaxID=2530386 RepID=A0A4R5BY81_9PSEU|nr:NAD(P)-dependent alcohol dehydrogenase [Saccharopolyspora karakumensis]TDD91245.1 NAD(P)-dependent alcohol dehydrogenase [Saccharopolyspora karakumensis]